MDRIIKMSFMKKLILIFVCIILSGVLGFVGYTAYLVLHAHQAGYSLDEYKQMYSDLSFTMIDGNTMKIVPKEAENKSKTGIIFYPGAMVDAQAYIPLMAELSEEGYVCYIEKMPLYMAILSKNQAAETMQTEENMEHWYIAGHSMGGMVAMNYAKDYSDQLDGLIVFGAKTYVDLSDKEITMISIRGDRDTVMGDDYEKYRKNNPKDVTEYVIEGGNHAQFGDYGSQTGDSPANITADAQREQAVTAVNAWLQK